MPDDAVPDGRVPDDAVPDGRVPDDAVPVDAVPTLQVGLLAAPGAPAELAGWLRGELGRVLGERHPEVAWDVRSAVDGLVQPPAEDDELVAAARRRLLAEDWDLAVVLTDVPLEVDRRPVVGSASPLHGVAVVSLPALGAVGLRRRAVQAVLDLLATLLGAGEVDAGGGAAELGRRLRALASDEADTAEGVQFTARVVSGNLRLLLGMVRANRPWRLAARLSRALTAAIAAGVFALITPDIWLLADNLGPPRLTVVAVGSVVAVVVTLLVGAQLWERPRSRRVRKQVLLFNVATTATVVIGVLTLYAALFLLALGGALLLVVEPPFAAGLGHAVQLSDYLELAWLTCSLATVGGALGAGLESDDSVREAAYTYRSSGPAG